VTAANGEALYGSRDLLRIRRQYHVGDEMPLTLWRGGEILEVVLKLDMTSSQSE